MKFFYYIFVFQLLLCSCTNINDNVTKKVQSLYNSRGIVFDKNLKTCLILPEVGCGGCIDGAVYFFE